MADLKISALPASTTPLAGTEVLPIVQSGATKQVSVSDLTAGRALIAAELTLSTGNLVIGTSGKGIDFSATPGTGTSELLSDYEEGTWTPTITGSVTAGTASYTVQQAAYTKVGRQVTVSCRVTWSGATGTGVLQISGLPFTTSSITAQVAQVMPFTLGAGNITYVMGYVGGSSTVVQLFKYAAGIASSIAVEASGAVIVTITYTAN